MDAAGPADGWLALIAAALADDPRVAPGAGRGFGSWGTLKVGGKIFAMSVGARLVLKLPAAQVAALVEAGDGHPFETSRCRCVSGSGSTRAATRTPSCGWPARPGPSSARGGSCARPARLWCGFRRRATESAPRTRRDALEAISVAAAANWAL